MIISGFKHLIPARTLLSWVDLPSSVYCYKNKGGRGGVKPSTHALKFDGTMVENQVVIETIKDVLSQEFCCYGYENVTSEMRKEASVQRGTCVSRERTFRLSRIMSGFYLQSLHFYLQSKFAAPKNIKVDSLNQF